MADQIIVATPRLYLRKIRLDDFNSICAILQDIDVMYAWEHAFSNWEVTEWLEENLRRYASDGFSYWGVLKKINRQFIGLCGLISENAAQESYVGLGYIFNKSFWNKGYAFESASACVDYAFGRLSLDEITAQIRPDNAKSIKLATKLGMSIKKHFVKQYRGNPIPHLLYSRVRDLQTGERFKASDTVHPLLP